jgi:phthiodiolone/phenolphthiodiolone dimycocerosates ketoreductase
MVGFWPDAIWAPEFTDLATVSRSPHRYLDGLVVAGAVAVRTERVRVAATVVDTVRRHPASIAQTALTLSHLSRGRFILGLGSGELENLRPYGFPYSRTVSRFEEALRVIRLLWDSDGAVDFEGQFFRLERGRLDTEPYEGQFPPIWIGAGEPRMLELTGRFGDGWLPTQAWTAEEFAVKLKVVRESAERAGRDPDAILTAATLSFLIGDEDELAEMVRTPLVKSWVLQVPAGAMHARGYEHPLGPGWRGFHDINPGTLTRERLVEALGHVDPQALLKILRHGTPRQVAEIVKGYCDAGLRVPSILDYSRMAGLEYAATSPAKLAQTEEEIARAVGMD